MHVNFKALNAAVPGPAKMLSLFENFIAATEDMNVLMGYTRKVRQRVLSAAKFV